MPTPVFFFALACERIFIKTHNIESRWTRKYTVCRYVCASFSPESLQAGAVKGLMCVREDCRSNMLLLLFLLVLILIWETMQDRVSLLWRELCPSLLTPPLPQPVKCLCWEVHSHTCLQNSFDFWSYNKSTFTTAHFDENFKLVEVKKKAKDLGF